MAQRLTTADARAALERAAGLRQAGRPDEAAALCRAVLAADRRHAGAMHLLGNLALDRRDAAGAIDVLTRARKTAPGDAGIRIDLGRAYVAAGRLAEAEQALLAAVRIDPSDVRAQCGLGYALQRQGRHDEAARVLEGAVRLDAGDGMAHYYLGNLRHAQRRFFEAESCHRAALALQPGSTLFLYNLGAALHEQGKLDEAQACYDTVLERSPDESGARLNRSLVRLLRGDIGAAWDDYRARPARRAIQAQYPSIRLTEELPPDLAGRSVLVVGEQGLGDELFFLRYAPALASRGARVRYRPHPKLASILRRCATIDEVDEDAVPAPGDLLLPVGDLPRALRGGGDTPAPLPLVAQTERVSTLRERLERAGPRPWLGIAWRAGTPLAGQSGELHKTVLKEIPVGQFARALASRTGTAVVLQRSAGREELAELEHALGCAVHDCSELNEDLEEMLALLSLLDEYAGVSSTNVHLRAGLGLKGCVLVPRPAEWRWLVEGDSTPWFPGYRVYRQARDGDWTDALAGVESDLRSGKDRPQMR